MQSMMNRGKRAMELLKEIRLIDEELGKILLDELLSEKKRPSIMIREVRDSLDCPTLWVLMVYQRVRPNP